MSKVTVDRSVDGEVIPAFIMHFQSLSSASVDGTPLTVLRLISENGKAPVALCRHCTSRLLESLLKLKEIAPEHFAEADDA